MTAASECRIVRPEQGKPGGIFDGWNPNNILTKAATNLAKHLPISLMLGLFRVGARRANSVC